MKKKLLILSLSSVFAVGAAAATLLLTTKNGLFKETFSTEPDYTLTFEAGDLTTQTVSSEAHGSIELVTESTKELAPARQNKVKFNYEYAPYGDGYTYLTPDLGHFENDFTSPIRSIKSIKVTGSYGRVGVQWGWSNGVDAINYTAYDDFFIDTPGGVFEFDYQKPNYFKLYALPYSNPAITEVKITYDSSCSESENPNAVVNGLKYLKRSTYAVCLGFDGSSFENVVVEDTVGGLPVTEIGYRAFYYDTTIESIDLGSNVRVVDEDSFRSTSNLTTVTGINNLTEIGVKAFYYSGVEGDVEFSSELTQIGESAFMDSHLSSVTFSDEGDPYVADAAFRDMSELVSIHIGSEMTQFYDDLTFNDALETITVGTGNTRYSAVDNVLFNDYYHTVISLAGNRPETSFTVPSGYSLTTYCAYGNKTLQELHLNGTDSRVPDYSFNYCTSLRSIDFGSYSGLSIHDSFAGCTALEELVIPSNVSTIYQRAFSGCTSLKWVEFEEGCTTLNREVFLNCTSLSHVLLPTTLTHIGESGGWSSAPTDVFNGCTALTTVLTRLELGESYSGTIEAGWYGSRTLLFHSDVSDSNAWHVMNGAPTAWATRTLYVQSNSEYSKDGAFYAVWAWNTKYDGYFFYDHAAPVNYLYCIELPLNYRCLTILRMESGTDASAYTTEFPVGKVWNQSPSYLMQGTYDEATVTGFGLDISWGTHA